MKNEIYFDLESSSYPKSWNELVKDQLLKVAQILYEDRGASRAQRLLTVLLGLGKNDHLLIVESDAEKVLQFIFEGIGLTENRLPKLKGKKLTLYGPEARLKHVNFDEFIAADTAFMRYMQGGNLGDLHKLIAILYRPAKRKRARNDPDFNGDVRQRFNSHTVNFRLDEARQLPMPVKLTILYFFAGCKAHFASRFPGLFTKSENKSANGGTWLHVLDAFTEHIGQYSEVLELPVNLVLFSMEETRKENERLLAQYS